MADPLTEPDYASLLEEARDIAARVEREAMIRRLFDEEADADDRNLITVANAFRDFLDIRIRSLA